MATDYEVTRGADGRVVVVLHPSCAIAKGDILALLKAAGIDSATVTFVDPDGIAECGSLEDVPVVIPLDDETCNLPELDSVGRECGTAGGRVIVLFGPSCSFDGLHSIAEKYGTQSPWSADRLKGCISGGADAPRDPAGKPQERPAPREVICRR